MLTIPKTCTKCLESLPTTEFNRKTKAKDGFASNCKTCYKKGRGKFVGALDNCLFCGKEFLKVNLSRSLQLYCSKSCAGHSPNKPVVFKKGSENIGWKGGQTTSTKGYVYLRRPEHPRSVNGYVKRANVVMETSIGRLLKDGEEVHHKNKIKNDDTLENLELLTRESHAALHGQERKVSKTKYTKEKQLDLMSKTVAVPKINWPSFEDLAKEVKETSLRKVAFRLGCSHVAVGKRLGRYIRDIS